MANEITVQTYLTFLKNSVGISRTYSKTLDVSGSEYISGTASAATGGTSLPLGSVGTIGWVSILNTDATNFVTLGADGTNYPIKCNPGEPMLVRWNGSAVHVKADTLACIVEFAIIED